MPANSAAIPSLLALSAVNRALIKENLRSETGIIIQSGEVREIMHFALLLGYGATAINPYLALQTVAALSQLKKICCDPVSAAENYIKAVDNGLLKIMSKLGISTLRSYRSAQTFEAVGLSKDFIDEFLPGTISRIGGIGINEIAHDANMRAHAIMNMGLLDDGGQYQFRKNGEAHLWTPQSLAYFRQAVRENNYEVFKKIHSPVFAS